MMACRISEISIFRTLCGICAFIFAATIWSPDMAYAQFLPTADEETQEAAPVVNDAFERQTPRSSVTALLNALAANDYEKAAHYFTGVPDPAAVTTIVDEADDVLSDDDGDESGAKGDGEANADVTAFEQPEAGRTEQAVELARKLKLALDAGGRLVPFSALSNVPSGDFTDGLAPTLERVGVIRVDGTEEPILMQHIELADTGAMQWRIAPETEAQLDRWEPPAALVEANQDDSFQVGGAGAVDWPKLVGLAVALFIAARVVAFAALLVLRKFIDQHDKNVGYRILHAALPPLIFFGAVVAYFIVAGRMEVAIVARQFLLRGAGFAAWASLAWFLFRLVDAVSRIVTERMRLRDRRQAASMIALLRRAAKLVLVIIVGIALFDTFGIDVTTGIAALAIGGLALALGAQKTIENFVGSLSVIMDKPVQVGDSAQIGTVFGTVEDVGIRSTSVRTLDRTLVSIPNGDLAAERIENYASRDQFLFRHTIGVTYDTSASRIQDVLEEFRDIIASHDHIIQDDARARFIGFGDSTINIEVFLYFRTRAFAESLEMQEDLLLKLMAKLEHMNVEIAFPTRTVIMQGKDTPEPLRDKT
ncbi:MAG: mechanosensitive ion channel family protein [Parvularcula sp.]|jgi:MscS family membrane protein|nr:mechanosensitive ion channel family protein [Parvularcula sp.]